MQAMKQFENFIDQQEQVKRIRLVMLNAYMDECDDCGKLFKAMYRWNGYPLCPCCHGDIIDEYKAKQGE